MHDIDISTSPDGSTTVTVRAEKVATYVLGASKEKSQRPSVVAQTEARNKALRAASQHEIYDVAKAFGLTDTQAGILRSISSEKPHFSDIARAYKVSAETVFNWGRVLGIRSKGREQPRPKLSTEKERLLKDAFDAAADRPVILNLSALSRESGISLTTLKIRAKERKMSGAGRRAPQRGPRRDELTFVERKRILTSLDRPHSSYQSIAREIGFSRHQIRALAEEYGMPSRKAFTTPVNVEQFLGAAELVVERHLSCAPPTGG